MVFELMDFSTCSSNLKFVVLTKFELQNEKCISLLIIIVHNLHDDIERA